MLRKFTLSTQVGALDAKHDKITLGIQHRTLREQHNHIGVFRDHLGGPPQGLRDSDYVNEYGRLFNRSRFRKEMAIRSSSRGAEPLFPLPLFGGNCAITRPPRSDVWLIDLNLNINPTRFLRYQDPLGFVPPRRGEWPTTFFKGLDLDTGEETSLNLKEWDNWLPDTPEFAPLHNGRVWKRVVDTYLDGVFNLIDEDVKRAAAVAGFRSNERICSDRFTLRTAETYFEFESTGPSSLHQIRRLERPLRSFSEQPAEVLEYPRKQLLGWEGVGLCPTLTIKIRSGVMLKIYAKTNRRIRFEVEHDFSDSNLRFRSGRGSLQLERSFATLQGIGNLLDYLRADAARELNRVIARLSDYASFHPTSKTAVDLIIDVSRIVEDPEDARILIDALIFKGSITLLPKYEEALRGLRKAGILLRRETGLRLEHVVTNAYKQPLKMLQSHPLLNIRERRRDPLQGIRNRVRHPVSATTQ